MKNYFFRGSPLDYTSRHFHISSVYDDCPRDVGWFVVVDKGTLGPCPIDSYAPRPYFAYSDLPIQFYNRKFYHIRVCSVYCEVYPFKTT